MANTSKVVPGKVPVPNKSLELNKDLLLMPDKIPLPAKTSMENKSSTQEFKSPKRTIKCPAGEVEVGSIVESCCVSVEERGPITFAYIASDKEKMTNCSQKLINVEGDIENSPEMSCIKPGDLVFAKSRDDEAWYRAIVEGIDNEMVNVYFYDWGLREALTPDRIRSLMIPELTLNKLPACGVKLIMNEKYPQLNEDFLKCTSLFNLKIDSYDKENEAYVATVLSAS